MTLQARIPRRLFAAALGACLLAAPAAAQQMDTTRWIRVDGEAAEALLADIFRTVSVASADPVQRVISFRNTLQMMDEAHLGFLAVSPEVARVYIDVMNPLSTYIRVRAETSVFAPMDSIVEAHWRASLDSVPHGLHADVHERVSSPGSPPRLYFNLRTDRQYPCLGYNIQAERTDSADTITLKLLGVALPGGDLCPTAMGPADLTLDLGRRAEDLLVVIDHVEYADTLMLEVDSVRFQLRRAAGATIRTDSTPYWRRPANGLTLSCLRGRYCEEVRAWLLSLNGVRPAPLELEGKVAWTLQRDYEHYLFRYSDPRTLDRVRQCFAIIGELIRESVGLRVTVETSDDVVIAAQSTRSNHENPAPPPATVTSGCRTD